MILAKINPAEEHLLEFSLNVQGTIERVTDVRFVIEGSQYNLSFPCQVDNNKVTVKIPRLNESVMPGIHDTKLEVVIGDKIFTPVSESVEILENIKVKVKEHNVSTTEIRVETTQEEDFTLVEQHGYQLLVKGNKYYGIVGKTKTLRSDVGCDSVESLLEHLSSVK